MGFQPIMARDMVNDFDPNKPHAVEPEAATVLLDRMNKGDSSAAAQLLPMVYEKLRAVAGGYFKDQARCHTLQPTALVHEAYVKLVGSSVGWKNQAHFCALASTAMRQILMDHAKSKRRAKRAHKAVDLSVSDLAVPSRSSVLDLVALDDTLTRLATQSARTARLVELRFFGGMNATDIAEVLRISVPTVERDWRHARAWLIRELGGEESL